MAWLFIMCVCADWIIQFVRLLIIYVYVVHAVISVLTFLHQVNLHSVHFCPRWYVFIRPAIFEWMPIVCLNRLHNAITANISLHVAKHTQETSSFHQRCPLRCFRRKSISVAGYFCFVCCTERNPFRGVSIKITCNQLSLHLCTQRGRYLSAPWPVWVIVTECSRWPQS